MIKRDREKDSQAIWPARETRREGNELASLRPDQRRWTAERLIRCSAIWERVAKVPNARAILVPTAIAAATRGAIAGAVCPGGVVDSEEAVAEADDLYLLCLCKAK